MAEYKGMKMTIEWETRLCEVNGEVGYFQTWEQWSNVVDASPLRGGHPGGVVSQVYGIVEFKDRVERVSPNRIKFCDEINDCLTMMANQHENSPSYKDSVERSKEPIDEIIDRVLGGESHEST